MPSTPTYLFEQSTVEEQRLRQQSTALDPLTVRFFERAGLTPGMRVLDLGTGGGDVAALAAELVGPEGYVLGVDRNPDALAGARVALADRPQVEFAQADILALDGIPNGFDAVVGRAVLAHVRDPETALRTAARHLRPGGLICMHEPDMTYQWTSESTPLWDGIHDWLNEVMEMVGVLPRMGPELFTAFRRAGLPDPELIMEAPVGGGDRSPAFGWANIIVALQPLVEKLDLPRPPVDDLETLTQQLNADIDSHDGTVMGPPMYGAWCTLP